MVSRLKTEVDDTVRGHWPGLRIHKPRRHPGRSRRNYARREHGECKICDEGSYSYWVPGLTKLISQIGFNRNFCTGFDGSG
jgi:hypothetical protein